MTLQPPPALLVFITFFFVAVGSSVAAQRDHPRPNLLVLLTDDQRWDTLGVYDPNIPIDTPNIDRLAHEGVLFTNAFVTTPVCAVSRASILTGRYASNHGMHRFQTVLDDDVAAHTYDRYLSKAGYFTGHFGKYGVGLAPPHRAAFDLFDGQSSQGPAFRNYNGKRLHDSEWLTVKTREFLDAVPKGQPFALQLSYKAPHASAEPAPEDDHLLDDHVFQRKPTDTPEAFAALPDVLKSSLLERHYAREFTNYGADDINPYMRQYFEKIVSVDRSVGAIMGMLEERGLAENTVVFFLSDHGTLIGEKGLAGKWVPYENSIRIPFIVRDPRPEALKGISREESVLNIDLAPTLLAMAGLPVPAIMDGESLVPLVDEGSDPESTWRTQFAFEHFTTPATAMRPIPRNDGIRQNGMKYVRWVDPEPVLEEVFDLRSDPNEMLNLARNPGYMEELEELRLAYESWRGANPPTHQYHTYTRRPQSGAPQRGEPKIDWQKFQAAHPTYYDRIAEQVEAMEVSWDEAVNDPDIRATISERAGFWY